MQLKFWESCCGLEWQGFRIASDSYRTVGFQSMFPVDPVGTAKEAFKARFLLMKKN